MTVGEERGVRTAQDFGHRPRQANDRASDRALGVRRALQEHDLDPTDRSNEEAPYSITDSGTAFHKLMQARPRPSIVMCGNDVQAVGAVKMAHSMGLSEPGTNPSRASTTSSLPRSWSPH